MNIRLFIVVTVYRYRLIVVHRRRHQLKGKRITLRLCSWSLIVLHLLARLLFYMFEACFWFPLFVVVVTVVSINKKTIRFACLHENIVLILLIRKQNLTQFLLYYLEEQRLNLNWNYPWCKLFKYDYHIRHYLYSFSFSFSIDYNYSEWRRYWRRCICCYDIVRLLQRSSTFNWSFA